MCDRCRTCVCTRPGGDVEAALVESRCAFARAWSHFNSVASTVTVGMEWVEERKIHQLKDLKYKHPNVDLACPPCPVCTVDDASKQPQQVVLTEMPGSEPVLRVYCKTEVQMDEHFLSPDTMLRAGQGDECFRQQLVGMVQMVPFSQRGTESEPEQKLQNSTGRGGGG